MCAHLTRSNRVVFYTLRHIWPKCELNAFYMLREFFPIETIWSCRWFVCCVFVWFPVCSFVALVKFHVSFSGFVCNQNKSRNALIYLWYVLNAMDVKRNWKWPKKFLIQCDRIVNVLLRLGRAAKSLHVQLIMWKEMESIRNRRDSD